MKTADLPSRHSRRTRAVTLVLIALALIGLLMAAGFRYARPQWHTWHTLYCPDINAAFSIEYPDDWLISDRTTQLSQTFHQITIERRIPTGPERWLRQTVLRQDPRVWGMESVDFDMYANDYTGANTESTFAIVKLGYFKAARQSGSQIITTRRFQHPVGAALEITDIAKVGVQKGSRLFQRNLFVLFLHRQVTGGMMVTVGCEMPEDAYRCNKATLDRIFAKFRIVEK